MLISPDYLELQKALHAAGRYGISSGHWADAVRGVKEREHCADILDYGCRQGQLRQALGDCVREYDPAIAGKDQDPEPADLVVCTDVLEHIEPDCLDDVLLHLRTKVKKRLVFAISLRPAGKTLADGRNAHLIVESAEWWLERLAPYFRVLEFIETGRRELAGIAKPVSIVGTIKSVGVMKDERNAHTRQNVLKTAKRIPDQPLAPNDRVALIACYGPSLRTTWVSLPQQRKKLSATLVSVSGAHDFLRKHNITPDMHVECDPRPHKAKMMRKLSRKTRYTMASCSHPDVIDALAGYDLTLWHLYNGPESFDVRNIRSEETAAMIPGGGSVGLRTITLLYFLGFRNFVVHGMDCSFDGEEQHAGAHSGKTQTTIEVNPVCKVGGETVRSDRWFKTSPVLVSYANHMLKDLRIGRYPMCNFYWYGDGLFQEMLRLQNLQMQALDADAQIRGAEPVYGEPKDYFSMTERDVEQHQETAA
jgi:6-hydroxymethylpterin diphosphokinase MptE-like